MASVVTIKDIESLRRKLKATGERVRGNRKEAIRVLHAAGITDEMGKYTEPYRSSDEK